MENQKVSITQLEQEYTLNGVKLKGPEWSAFIRTASKCGVNIETTQAEKTGKGKAANLHSFNRDFVFVVEKK